jgi:hypothetical protein
MGENSSSSQYSSSNYANRKKANTHFYPSELSSIHNLFLFTSTMTELVPSTSPSQTHNPY